jgi:glycosyltransferase involved in cell wall biosynthesis
VTGQGAPGKTSAGEGAPLVSIFMFVRNGAASLDRALASVRAQTYPNIEFIVQDGVSTDGTLDILHAYGGGLKLVSEPDSGPNEGLWRAVNRCTGEFIGSCLSDEELMPDAVERAVAVLQKNPDVGAITGDAILTDLAGTQTGFWKSGPFNFVDYLLCDYTPYFVSSFFRRQSLLDAGLKAEKWGTDCVEFELWCRLASCSRVMYIPETIAKYASHPGQSSHNPRDVVVHFTGRLNNIIALCEGSGPLSGEPLLRALFIWGHARVFTNHAIGVGRPEMAAALYRVTRETAARFAPVELDGIPYDENFAFRRAAQTAWNDLSRRIPGAARALFGPATVEKWGARYRSALAAAKFEPPANDAPSIGEALMTALGWRPVATKPIVLPPPPSKELKARMYARLAQGYGDEGRLEEASEIWRDAARLAGLLDLEAIGR